MPNTTLPKGTQVPNHIAIITDGNRRWARARGLEAIDGHKAGYKALREVVNASRKFGVHTLTVWAFSTENWDRPSSEIQNIMALVKQFLKDFEKESIEENEQIRFVHLGRKDRLPSDIIKKIQELEEKTKNYNKYVFNIALDYGGQNEIVRAVQKIVKDGISANKIDEKLISSYLDTANQPYPYPDLFIRTSGEQRTSGLLPWQMTYAEFYWEIDHLPDANIEKLREAIMDYSRRRRRFGGNDKVTHFEFSPELVAGLELSWWRLSKLKSNETLAKYAIDHVKQQFGLSAKVAREASKYLLDAFMFGQEKNWQKSGSLFTKFYEIIRDELRLALEPELAASLEVKLWQKAGQTNKSEASGAEENARKLVSEVYRISDFQAAKAGHLRMLAAYEKNQAEKGGGELHWNRALDFLTKYYKALKDRVA